MNYAEFKTHLMDFVWRLNDPAVEGNLDNLVAMGEASLRADLRAIEEETSAVIYPSNHDVVLPEDVYTLIGIASHLGEHTYVSSSRMLQLRIETNEAQFLPRYAKVGNIVMLCGPYTAESELARRYGVVLTYATGIPNFKKTDQSWFADRYLDVYTYAVLQHLSLFIKDDERVSAFAQLYNAGVDKINDKHSLFDRQGTPSPTSLPYPASPALRKNIYGR